MSEREHSSRHNLRSRALASVAAVAIVASGAVGAAFYEGQTPAFAQGAQAPITHNVQAPFSFADVVEKVKPAVVSVRVKVASTADEGERFSSQLENLPPQMREFFKRFGENRGFGENGPRPQPRVRQGAGSGFFISADGYLITNNHVVDKAKAVEVVMDDGRSLDAKVVGTDPKTDLALLKVTEGGDFPYVRLAKSTPRVGDWVVAIGNPFGLGGTVTAGIVSARGRDIGAGPYDDFIQIDAPVNKGNSGGPTFDIDGNVIGVNTAIFSPSGGSVGIAFAIPAETVRTIVAQLRENGAVTRGWIGVKVQPVTADIADSLGLKEAKGALVTEPQDGSPAANAGIAAGDVITEVNGAVIEDARDLAKKISSIAPGSAVKLTVVRKGSEKAYSLALGTLPKEQQLAKASTSDDGERGAKVPRLGLTLAPAKQVAGSGDEGLVVTAVDPDGPAASRGFKTGDVILEAGGKTVSVPSDVSNAIAGAQKDGKRSILVRIRSGGGTRFVALPVDRA
jgi:serine protease Do